jgi:hypothetical protein
MPAVINPRMAGVSGDAPEILAQSAIPFILAGGTAGGGLNQFTAGAAGAISTLATLPTTYSGGGWLYLPAGTYSGQASAGWFWFVASSTTAGTVYNNQYTSGDPRLAVPTSPTAFGAGVGLVTQTTGSDITAFQFLLPGNSLGRNGRMESLYRFESNSSANAKTLNLLFGGAIGLAGGTGIAGTMTSVATAGAALEISNVNSTSSQSITPRSFSTPYGPSGNAGIYASYDTTADQYFGCRLQLSTASDYVMLVSSRHFLMYGA